MILLNMTPEEKKRQASRLEYDVRSAARSWVEHNMRMLKMRKSYPFVHTIKREFKDMGVWYIILSFRERPKPRKGIFFASNAYQKYYVSKGARAENLGAGIYFIGGSRSDDGTEGYGTTFYDFTPHFFNRFRERYLDVTGQSGMTFSEMVMAVYHSVQAGISYDPILHRPGEEVESKFSEAMSAHRFPGYENLAIFVRHGLCLGFRSPSWDYYCYLTYIGQDEFFETQSKVHERSNQMLDVIDRVKAIDPYFDIDKEQLHQRQLHREALFCQ